MQRHEAIIGRKVLFGRTTGEQTLGILVKLNNVKAKVQTLEGRGKRATPGQIWHVPYQMMRYATEAECDTAETPEKKMEYTPFAGIDNLILDCISAIYGDLSPENLTMDGEASPAHVRQTRTKLETQLYHLQKALGYTVSEEQIYQWETSKRDWKTRHSNS